MKIGIALGKRKVDIASALTSIYGKKIAADIISKTGPRVLFYSESNENSLTLGIDSIHSLIGENSVDFAKIKNLISVTETPVMYFPGNATQIASSFSFDNTLSTFDLNAGCTGFVDAIKIALGQNGQSLIICSETYSKHIVTFNRTTSSLFSDGACAVLFDPTEWTLINSFSLYRPFTFNAISVNAAGHELVMNGREVFNFVMSDVLPELTRIISGSCQINRAYLHQASEIVNDTLRKKLSKFDIKVPRLNESTGNFVSATLPLLVAEDTLNNPINPGECILIAGFGVGLSFSACLLKKNE
jgi:3-oxoacyl-[acyl-carrier-protein] synthase-3